MRATALALLLVVTTLPLGDARGLDDTSAHQIVWILPEVAYVDHPVHGAIVMSPTTDPLDPQTHSDLNYQIEQDGQVLFSSDSVHEHDGIHTFTFTPRSEGTLVLRAGDTRTHPGHSVGHGAQPATGEAAGVATLDVLPQTFIENQSLLDARVRAVAYEPTQSGHGFTLTPGNLVHVGHPHIRHEIRGGDGRLLLSVGGSYPDSGEHVRYDAPETAFGRGWFGPGGASPEALGGRLAEAALSLEATTFPNIGFALTQNTPPCDPDHVRTDPNSVVDGTLAWQSSTDIRVTVLDPSAQGVVVSVRRDTPGTTPSTPVWARASDTLPNVAFRAPEPGNWRILVASALFDDSCEIPFTSLPDPDPTPGDLRWNIAVDEPTGTANITLTAAREGETLPHYEFDTRVYRISPDGDTLVWLGKLHGHAGTATLGLGALRPGDYFVHTYPSPQDLGTPALATDDPRGFAATFTIAQTAFVDDVPAPVEPRATSAPSGVLLLLLATLVGLALRRAGSAP